MPEFFDRPDPQQHTPGDLRGVRRDILQLLQGGSGLGRLQDNGGGLGILASLFGGGNPAEGVLGPLRASADERLEDQIGQLNASSPGRFSSANLYTQGQLRRGSQNDFNLLSSQVLQQGQDRQLQTLMALLGPTLNPTFGGPFTQGASGFDHLLGGIGTVLPFIGGGMGGSGARQSYGGG